MIDKSALSILIVDDSKNFAEVLTESLRKLGFTRVAHAASANEAVKALSIQSFNLLFVDVVMPDINGIELTRSIRKTHKDLRIITMSSLAQEKIILEAISSGANDFVQKPIPEHILGAVLEKSLGIME